VGDGNGFALRWLLPAEFADGDVTRPRRTPRDWVIDVLVFCGAVLLGLVVAGLAWNAVPVPPWMQALDLALGALACLSLWWRRRFPLAVALLAVPAQALSTSASGAGIAITIGLAQRVPWRWSLPVLGLYMAAAGSSFLFLAGPRHDGWIGVAVSFAYYLVSFACGSALRARRLWVLAMRRDAERERADHSRRLADTRRAEREAIAREMHDVLAHRISLLSVHAGALVYRSSQRDAGSGPDLGTAEVAESARIIRDNAHQALEELHDVLRVLRADDGGTAPPQPRMADLRTLVEEARAAGQPVDVQDGLDGPAADALRPQLQRTAYRVVQEGLTNARKHAPGTRVAVRLTGTPGSALTVEVANPVPDHESVPRVPGTGAGLVGLAERVELDGGALEYGRMGGVFTLRARLPWMAR
jgi:signal transduction histidine kinase